jgi:hypothetical protein
MARSKAAKTLIRDVRPWGTVAPGSAPPLPLQQFAEAGIREGLGEDGQRG